MGNLDIRNVAIFAVVIIAASVFLFITFKKRKKSVNPSNDLQNSIDISAQQIDGMTKDEINKIDESKSKNDYPPVKAYVYDNITGRCKPEEITGEQVKAIVSEYKTLGRPRDKNRTGKFLFYLDRYKDDSGKVKLKPCGFPYSIENTAEILYMATEQPEVPHIWNFAEIKGLMQKYGPVLLFAAFGIFMLWSYGQH
jgi:hypothetical protein